MGGANQQSSNCPAAARTCIAPPPWCQRLVDEKGCVKCLCGQGMSFNQGIQFRMVLVVIFFFSNFCNYVFFWLLLYWPTALYGGYISPSLTANTIFKSFLKYE